MSKVDITREKPKKNSETLVVKTNGRTLRLELDQQDWMNLESLARRVTNRLNGPRG